MDKLWVKEVTEGIQCLCKVNEGIGLALKVEDGSKRAKHAVSVHLLKQLEWISDLKIQISKKRSSIFLKSTN